VAPRQLAAQGAAQQSDVRRVEQPSGEALRIEYANGAANFELVQWYVVVDDVVWTLTFNAGDLAEYGGFVDAVAQTFDVTDGGETGATDPGTAPGSPTSRTTRIVAPDGAFAADIPTGWVIGFPGEGAPPLGEQMFPDDPAAASLVTPVEAALVTPQTRMLALDPVGWDGPLPLSLPQARSRGVASPRPPARRCLGTCGGTPRTSASASTARGTGGRAEAAEEPGCRVAPR